MNKNHKPKTSLKLFQEQLSSLYLAPWEALGSADTTAKIQSLLPLVGSICRKIAAPAHLLEDAVAVGNLSLVKAVHGWRPDMAPVHNYVYHSVYRDITRFISKEMDWEQGRESLDWPPLAESVSDEDGAESGLGLALRKILDSIQSEDMTPDEVSDAITAKDWLERLSREHKAVIAGVYLYGMSMQEVADSQGVSRQAIKERHDRALKQMRRDLTGMRPAR